MGIADQLTAGPKHSNDVAARIGADSDGVHRPMRALSSRGVLTQHADGSFTLTRVGDALRPDTEGSLRRRCLRAEEHHPRLVRRRRGDDLRNIRTAMVARRQTPPDRGQFSTMSPRCGGTGVGAGADPRCPTPA
ncbi:MAG: hypothetical protein SV966_13465 [Actinomycetota bacterium]|nr:hypothetical protein [Actinomycetota bacterium]